MKITLSAKEKENLIKCKSISIERESYLSAPKKSIIHGVGIGGIFDKVDYRWVYGNTSDYIKQMMNVGRRATDYPDNKKNTCSGGYWYEFPNRIEDEFGVEGSVFKSGRKHQITFKVDKIFISELRQGSAGSYGIIFTVNISNQQN